MDRAALDAALCQGLPAGGWCPAGRRAEDGSIPERYPLEEHRGGYLQRTRQNVIDSDATLIIHFGALLGGTRRTHEFCMEHSRPCLLIDGNIIDADAAVELIRRFVTENRVRTLNVAGPRASNEARAYPYTRAVLEKLFSRSD